MTDHQTTATDNVDAVWEFLAAIATVAPDSSDISRMHSWASRISDWSEVAERAETHGVAPLASLHIRTHDIDVDRAARRGLNALVLRHRAADAVLNNALINMLAHWQSLQLTSLVLKGSALANLIYPESGLRPRRDIDVLTEPGLALQLQRELVSLGYDSPDQHPVRAMRFHHHLPVASQRIDGMTVSVEVHRDALSGDYPQRLTVANTVDAPQTFHISDCPAKAFGHRDMLHHLCCHALEPGEPMRLMTMADITGYAQHFEGELDWELLRRSHPQVVNALSHLHYVRPLPDSLRALHPDPALPPPDGIGQNMPTLKQILEQPITRKAKLSQMLFPSTWWMRAYYGAAPGAPLGRLRAFKHLPRIARWASRRLVAQGVPGRQFNS